jgi:L-amino acid N-acyltransferase YncA
MPKTTTAAIVRDSRPEDIPLIAAIYAHYVLHTSASFEVIPPDAEEFASRRASVLDNGLPHIVAEVDGSVRGFAYAGLYRRRAAYRFTVENSIYIHPTYIRRGIGSRLMTALIRSCERSGYRQMIAVIGGGQENVNSIALHESFGFKHAGTLFAAGFKFGRWLDSVLMQRPLGEGDRTLPEDASQRSAQ